MGFFDFLSDIIEFETDEEARVHGQKRHFNNIVKSADSLQPQCANCLAIRKLQETSEPSIQAKDKFDVAGQKDVWALAQRRVQRTLKDLEQSADKYLKLEQDPEIYMLMQYARSARVECSQCGMRKESGLFCGAWQVLSSMLTNVNSVTTAMRKSP